MQKSSLRKKERNCKMEFKIGIRFHRAEITYFEINRLYAYLKQIQQADYAKEYNFDKSSSIKLNVYQNCDGNTFSFILHVCYFSYHPSIAGSEARSLTTLFFTKMRGKKHSYKNINILVFQICSRNNKTWLLLYSCKVIYLINKGVISPYILEQGGILKF